MIGEVDRRGWITEAANAVLAATVTPTIKKMP
jgi:hypothetical protein